MVFHSLTLLYLLFLIFLLLYLLFNVHVAPSDGYSQIYIAKLMNITIAMIIGVNVMF